MINESHIQLTESATSSDDDLSIQLDEASVFDVLSAQTDNSSFCNAFGIQMDEVFSSDIPSLQVNIEPIRDSHGIQEQGKMPHQQTPAESFSKRDRTNDTINIMNRFTLEHMKKVFMTSYKTETNDKITDDVSPTHKITPGEFDIICGRGETPYRHIGNKRFRVIIKMNCVRYQTATARTEKTCITSRIVAMIRSCQQGGRFLKFNAKTNEFFDVGDNCAREKVSHALRSTKDQTYRKMHKKKKSITRIYTDQENILLTDLLEEQQRIYRKLVLQQELNG